MLQSSSSFSFIFILIFAHFKFQQILNSGFVCIIYTPDKDLHF